MERVRRLLDENHMLKPETADAVLETFKRYMELTLEWNEKINVTAIRDRDDFIEKNILDSLSILSKIDFRDVRTVMDVGTGGGLPGVPMAIVLPNIKFTLMDSVKKKLTVIDEVTASLGLKNVETLHMRAEDAASSKLYRERFDIVVSRAVANMSTLSEYCLPFAKVGGRFVAYKTAAAMEEIRAAAVAVKELGGSIQECRAAAAGTGEPGGGCSTLQMESIGDGSSGHILVVVNKIKATPPKYPRKAGLPLKQPIK